jgi:hypothetical protein
MMNMEDEEEYVDFYDFSKTYENHPLLIKNALPDINPIKEDVKGEQKAQKKEDGSDSEWDDCDVEDAESGEEDTEKSYVIVDESESFSKVSKPDTTSQGFSIINKPDTADYCADSISSI